MIEMPKRSVTRFFIPLIDVLTLLFCIYLLMPMVQSPAEAEGPASSPAQEVARLRQENDELRAELARLKQRASDPARMFVCPLYTGDKGRLYFNELKKPGARRELTAGTVADLIREQRRLANGRELYFLIITPRTGSDIPTYPLRFQLEEYDRWFQDLAHSHVYYALPGR